MTDPTGDLGIEKDTALAMLVMLGLGAFVVLAILLELGMYLWTKWRSRDTSLSFWQWVVGLGAIVALSVRAIFRKRP